MENKTRPHYPQHYLCSEHSQTAFLNLSTIFFLIDDIPHSIYYILGTNFFIILFSLIYFWLCWVLTAEQAFL